MLARSDCARIKLALKVSIVELRLSTDELNFEIVTRSEGLEVELAIGEGLDDGARVGVGVGVAEATFPYVRWEFVKMNDVALCDVSVRGKTTN
jgi:hypothetical protein